MTSILDSLLPPNSHQRMMAGIVRELARAPSTFLNRFNQENFSNFLKYRNYRFACTVCGNNATPLYDFPDVPLRREHRVDLLRETLQCRRCLASMRQRCLAFGLIDYLNGRLGAGARSIAELAQVGFSGVAILDSDNFSRTSMLLRNVPGYVRCSYIPSEARGKQFESGYFNIDLQAIDFDDASFDVVLTSDVMEHVRDCDAAHAEIFRILKPGGVYVFNVPYDEHAVENIQLVDTSTDQDRFLCKPHIHGDPLTGGVLAYRIFGRALLGELAGLGFTVDFQRVQQASSLIVDGDLFVARKPLS